MKTSGLYKPWPTPFYKGLFIGLLSNCDELEDEYNLLICCPRYTILRFKYILKYYYQYPNMYTFTKIINSRKQNCIRKTDSLCIVSRIYYIVLYILDSMLSKKETKLCILMTETFQSTDHRIDVFEF